MDPVELDAIWGSRPWPPTKAELGRALAASRRAGMLAERERCAKVAEGREDGATLSYRDPKEDGCMARGWALACKDIAAAIRAAADAPGGG